MPAPRCGSCSEHTKNWKGDSFVVSTGLRSFTHHPSPGHGKIAQPLVRYGVGNCDHADSRKSPSLEVRVYKAGPLKGLGINSSLRALKYDER